MDPKEACSRRDFTINAMMQDVLTGEVLDYYGGRKDLEEKRICHIRPASFQEDSLRVPPNFPPGSSLRLHRRHWNYAAKCR